MNATSRQASGVEAANSLIDGLPYEEPTDEASAHIAVDELGRILTARKFFAELIARSLLAAKQMASDPLQGLTEILQNADDAGASTISLAVRPIGAKHDVLIVHNGTLPVKLRDVLAMSAPWVTTKQTDDEATGRFGIGFKIVHAFCDEVDVHSGPYHFEANGTRLHTVSPELAVPGFYDPDGGSTLIRLRLRKDVEVERIIAWVRDQTDTNLLFLSSLRRICFVDLESSAELFDRTLRITDGVPPFLDSIGEEPVTVAHTVAETSDGSQWDRFEAVLRVPTDEEGLERAEKSTGEFTRLSIALPRRGGPQPLYVTFPMRIVSTLPFALNAQFDPVVSRESLQDTKWNRWLIKRLGQFVAVVARRTLAVSPFLGWGAVPLPEEGVTCGQGAWLMQDLKKVLAGARSTIAETAVLQVAGALVPLSKIAYEGAELTDLLNPEDVGTILEGYLGVPFDSRDTAGRWRCVLDALEGPRAVDSSDLLATLARRPEAFQGKPASWFVRVLAHASKGGFVSDDGIRDARLVVDRRGIRHRAEPRSASAVVLAISEEIDGFAHKHGLVIELEDAFADDGHEATEARRWLAAKSTLVQRIEPAHLLSAYANAYQSEPREIEPDEFRLLRDLFEKVSDHDAVSLGKLVGAAILLEGYRYEGKAIPVRARAADAYLPQRYEREIIGWAAAAERTPGLVWVNTDYEDQLKVKGRKAPGEIRARGARAFLTLLGVRALPRLMRSTEPAWPGRHHSWRSANGLQIFDDYVSTDLKAVLNNIENDSLNGAVRAAALYRCILRNWDRSLEAISKARAGRKGRHGFNERLQVPATWLAMLIDRQWLRDEVGIKARPKDLIIRGERAEAIYGAGARYAAELRDDDIQSSLATALEIEQRAPASRLIQQLEAMREGTEPLDPSRVTRCYLALAEQCPPPSSTSILEHAVGDIGVRTLRGKFGMKQTGTGLLYDPDGHTWKSPLAFYRGPDIFRGLRPRVPTSEALLPLWVTLGIREPTIDDCVKEIERIAKSPPSPDLDSFLVNVYHHIQSRAAPEKLRANALASLPLICGDRWVRDRPVYVIEGFEKSTDLIARASELRIWTPPCDTQSVRDLLRPLDVTEIRPSVKISNDGSADAVDDAARERFLSAALELQDDIARNVPTLYGAIGDWGTVQDAEVRVHDAGFLRLTLSHPAWSGADLSISERVYADRQNGCVHVETLEDLANVDRGGRAVASFFAPDVRREVALLWMAAWSRSDNRITAAIELARDEDNSLHVKALAAKIDAGLKKRRVSPTPTKSDANGSVGSSRVKPTTPEIEERFQRLRDFDPGSLNFVEVKETGAATGPRQHSKPDLLGAGDGGGSGAGSNGGGKRILVRKQYEDVDVESLALAYVVHVLSHSDDERIEDIRMRRRGGADATIDWRTFVEIKSFYGPAPSTVDLPPHECERARNCGRDFILAVVSGLGDDQDLEIRLIVDPLRNATWEARRGISIKQINKASLAIVIRESYSTMTGDIETAA